MNILVSFFVLASLNTLLIWFPVAKVLDWQLFFLFSFGFIKALELYSFISDCSPLFYIMGGCEELEGLCAELREGILFNGVKSGRPINSC